jgi:hypothetical protein
LGGRGEVDDMVINDKQWVDTVGKGKVGRRLRRGCTETERAEGGGERERMSRDSSTLLSSYMAVITKLPR